MLDAGGWQSDWLPLGEALEKLGMSRTTFWRLRREGLISAVALCRVGPGRRSPLRVNVPAVLAHLHGRTIRLESVES
ncbi:hypothetical protein [Cyanobium sp. PCC 7001]|uniref:hypothetical protein n=1 Tax=Cyanobium sp. PCC 7001 TaxID=180281 RepID=UPI001CECD492|nr:hypothetical protein [Cyanobium sp. PCC 7001]